MALSVRFKHRSESSAKNDLRHELRRGPQPKYIDAKRTYLNTVIIEPASPSVLRDLCAERRKLIPMQRRAKITDSVSSSSIITFGVGLQFHVDALNQDRQDELYASVARSVAEHLGIEVTGLVAHRDEVAPHAHGQHPARHPDGRPMGKVITRNVASEIQDVAMEAARPFLPMIERGKKRAERIKDGDDPSTINNRSVRQLHDDLPKEIEARRQELVVAEARVIDMQGRVDKLRDREELSQKEAKRLGTYEKRLADREADLEDVRAAQEAQKEVLQAERAELDREAGRQIDERQELLSEAVDLDQARREIEKQQREIDKLRKALQGVAGAVSSMIGEVADRLGVGRKLREISEVIRSVGIEVDPDDGRPSM